MADHSKKNDADAQFAKAQRAEDGRKAMTEYESEAAATRAKTERLRALRLARDAAGIPPPAKPKAAKKAAAGTTKAGTAKKAPAKKKSKKETSTLSEWMDNERKDGRS
ncbi:MAG: hypothetical protein JWN71_770 [Xanthobacteraceae bacterium]|nr:hypothetical protein [Xanthobacteraceae bacterium]